MQNLNEAVEAYVERCRAANPNEHFEIVEGRKYIRIIHSFSNQQEIFAFIETDMGNILKPATWSNPTKRGVRGNVFTSIQPLRTRDFYIFNTTTPEEIMKKIEADLFDPNRCANEDHLPDGNGFCFRCGSQLGLEIIIK
jgi:hypothetical protein